jgi:hypothetical protein
MTTAQMASWSASDVMSRDLLKDLVRRERNPTPDVG